jgi:hypothetical protein
VEDNKAMITLDTLRREKRNEIVHLEIGRASCRERVFVGV